MLITLEGPKHLQHYSYHPELSNDAVHSSPPPAPAVIKTTHALSAECASPIAWCTFFFGSKSKKQKRTIMPPCSLAPPNGGMHWRRCIPCSAVQLMTHSMFPPFGVLCFLRASGLVPAPGGNYYFAPAASLSNVHLRAPLSIPSGSAYPVLFRLPILL